MLITSSPALENKGDLACVSHGGLEHGATKTNRVPRSCVISCFDRNNIFTLLLDSVHLPEKASQTVRFILQVYDVEGKNVLIMPL